MKTSFGAPAVAAVVLVAAGALAQQPRGADSSQKAPEISRELSQLQRELQQAGSGPDYQRLRTQSLSVRDKAISLNRRDLAFVAEATAFIASNRQRKHTQNQIEALPLILQALADSRTALSDFPFAADRATADSFVINLALLLEDASTFPFTLLNARPRSNDLLKELASAVEQSIPIDFHLGPRSRDPNESLRQSVQVSEYLATLSFRYGNAAVAVKRLTAAAEVARGIGDADLWAAMLSTLYDGEKAAGALSTRTKDLRAQARRAATALRASYASRAGRIWATYRSDALYGKMLRDQLGEAGESPGAIFAAVEALKARTLLDELKLPRATIVSSKRASDTEQRAIGFDKLPDVMFQGNEMLRSESRFRRPARGSQGVGGSV